MPEAGSQGNRISNGKLTRMEWIGDEMSNDFEMTSIYLLVVDGQNVRNGQSNQHMYGHTRVRQENTDRSTIMTTDVIRS